MGKVGTQNLLRRARTLLCSPNVVVTPPRWFARKSYSLRAETTQRPFRQSRHLGKTLLLVSFTAIGAYAYGVRSTISPLPPLLTRFYHGNSEPQYGTVLELEKAISEMREALSDDFVSIDDEDLKSHGYSTWSTVNSDRLPVAVVYPQTTEDVSQMVKICNKYRVPMIPFSGGSSLEGNFSAPYGGVSVDFCYMDKVIKLNEADMDVVVQPAVSWMTLNDLIAPTGLFFPVDPGPSAKVGGMVGTNCSGTNAVRYGTMKDWVINLTVVLSDGTIIKTRRRPRKTSAGYNLTSLFVGSEGTLGIITEATLKLAVIPPETSVAVVTFPSIRDAAEAASAVMRAGIPIAALEIMDEVQMSVINRSNATPNRVWTEAPTLFFKFSGTSIGVRDNIAITEVIAKHHRGGRFEFARDKDEARTLWSARKEALWSMLSLRSKGEEVWSTDVAVPLSRLSDIIEISKKEMDQLGLFASVLGHVGDGNFHESIIYDRNDKNEVARVEKCVGDLVDRALAMQGTCTGEHGIGMGKKKYLEKELGPETLGVMRLLKGALDPKWILNPGKIIDGPTL